MSTPDWTAWERSEWKRWHRSREQQLAAPYGWLSVTSLHWLDEVPRPIEGFPGLWSGDGYEVRVELERRVRHLHHDDAVFPMSEPSLFTWESISCIRAYTDK